MVHVGNRIGHVADEHARFGSLLALLVRFSSQLRLNLVEHHTRQQRKHHLSTEENRNGLSSVFFVLDVFPSCFVPDWVPNSCRPFVFVTPGFGSPTHACLDSQPSILLTLFNCRIQWVSPRRAGPDTVSPTGLTALVAAHWFSSLADGAARWAMISKCRWLEESRQSVHESRQRTAAKWQVSAGFPPVGGGVFFLPSHLGTLGPAHDSPLPAGWLEAPMLLRVVDLGRSYSREVEGSRIELQAGPLYWRNGTPGGCHIQDSAEAVHLPSVAAGLRVKAH